MNLRKTAVGSVTIILLLYVFCALFTLVNAKSYDIDPNLCIHHPYHTQECGGGDESNSCNYICEYCQSINLEEDITKVNDSSEDTDNLIEFPKVILPGLELFFNEKNENKSSDSENAFNKDETNRDESIDYELNDYERLQLILNKIEEDYLSYGVLPPSIISEKSYMSNISTVSIVTGTIPNRKFDFKDEYTNKTLSSESVTNWNGYRANNNVISANDFPDLTSDSYIFSNVTVDGVKTLRIGIIQLKDIEDPYYYYLTEEERGNDRISATILPENTNFQVNYIPREFNITYSIKAADGSDLPKGIEYDDLLNTVFGENRPTVTTNTAYSFTVTVPYFYTGEVYYYVDGSSEKHNAIEELHKNPGDLNSEDKANFYPLGTDPIYQDKEVPTNVDTSISPSTLTWTETFYNNNVTSDRHIEVVLKKKTTPKFYAKY